MSADCFWTLGHLLTRHKLEGSSETGIRKFREFFGCSPEICSMVWNLLRDHIPVYGTPSHLLWALLFLKRYLTEHVMSSLIGADEKTIRKWVWTFVGLMSEKLYPVNYSM
jgi:hypothetical protein